MHTAKSLKDKKKIVSYFHTIKIKKIYMFSMHFGFNNQFIKVMRTGLIFQIPKKIFCFLLVYGITNLYVKCIPVIKKVVFFSC